MIHTSMASAVARAYNGGLGAEPQRGSRGQSPGGGSGGRTEADEVFVFKASIFQCICYAFA